jgi:hypothetical protein
MMEVLAGRLDIQQIINSGCDLTKVDLSKADFSEGHLASGFQSASNSKVIAKESMLDVDVSEAALQSRIAFIDQISKSCINFIKQEQFKHGSQDWSTLMALAFFIRRANLEKICSDTRFRKPKKQRLIFHVLPNNAVTMALFTWVLAHLMGHRSVVRISSRNNPVTKQFIQAINSISADLQHQDDVQRLVFISYPHQQETNIALSNGADKRVIWGGDRAIAAFESIDLIADADSVQFPSRQSIALIHAAGCINNSSICLNTIKQWAADFVVDHLPFNQQACSSAKAVFWIQGSVENCALVKMQQAFWTYVTEFADQARFYSGSDNALERLVWRQHVMLNQRAETILDSKQVSVIQIQKIAQRDYDENHGFGCFYQMGLESIEQVKAHSPSNLQTIAVAGIAETTHLNSLNHLLGGKRVVLFGQCLALDTLWDGQDLIDIMANQSTDAD